MNVFKWQDGAGLGTKKKSCRSMELSVVYGRPGMGKIALVLKSIENRTDVGTIRLHT